MCMCSDGSIEMGASPGDRNSGAFEQPSTERPGSVRTARSLQRLTSRLRLAQRDPTTPMDSAAFDDPFGGSSSSSAGSMGA